MKTKRPSETSSVPLCNPLVLIINRPPVDCEYAFGDHGGGDINISQKENAVIG
jgi:hypothetical protein